MALPTKQAAAESEAWLEDNALGPACLEKLATVYGIRPRGAKEIAQILQMGAVLAKKHRDGQYKTAAEVEQERPNPFIDHAMAVLGVSQTKTASHHNDDYVKQASLDLAKTNQLALNAALIYDHVLHGGELQDDVAA